MKYKALILIVIVMLFTLSGCADSYENDDIVKVGYIGDCMELPLFTAYENGYFEKEGLKIELVKINDKDIEEQINKCSIDAFTCDYRFFKWNEDSVSIKAGIGLASGAVEIIASKKSNIKRIQDIKNKKIGVESQGNGAMASALRLFNRNNIGQDSIEWIYLNGESPIDAINEGKIDAAVVWNINKEYDDDINIVYKTELAENKNLPCNNHSAHSKNYFYINFAGVRAEIADKYPEKTAGILRAWSEGANTVEEKRNDCLKMALEKGYIESANDEDKAEINYFMWMPSVKSAKDNLKEYIRVQKESGMLKDDLNEDVFFNNIVADVLPLWD
ncbi:MAG: ABC transporter substrate-binding protein [Clostridium sp.]